MNKITIAIPVYNGAETVGETIESALAQAGGFDYNILVIDNNSTDNTVEVVRRYTDHPNLTFVQNETNIGYDGNFSKCFELANTEYVWMVGDDDVVKPEGISSVMEILNSSEGVGAIFVNYSMVNRKSGKVTKYKDVPIYNNILFDPGPETILKLKEFPNFMSSLIIYREDWFILDYKKYLNTLYVHYGIFLDLSFNRPVYVYSEPLIENKRRTNNYEHKPEFYQKYLNNLVSLLSLIDKNKYLSEYVSLKNEVIKDILDRRLYNYLRVHKRMGGRISSSLREKLYTYCKLSKKGMALYYSSYVPGVLIKLVFNFKKIFRNHD